MLGTMLGAAVPTRPTACSRFFAIPVTRISRSPTFHTRDDTPHVAGWFSAANGIAHEGRGDPSTRGCYAALTRELPVKKYDVGLYLCELRHLVGSGVGRFQEAVRYDDQ